MDFAFRYDDAAPRAIPGTSRSHTLPNAIPPGRIIPRRFATDMQYHLSQRKNFSLPQSIRKPKRQFGTYNWNHDYAKDHRTLYLYNPSVVPLLRSGGGESEDPDWLSPADMEALTGGDDTVQYLAFYRTYLGSNCFGPTKERALMTAGEQISYAAFALLNGASSMWAMQCVRGYVAFDKR